MARGASPSTPSRRRAGVGDRDRCQLPGGDEGDAEQDSVAREFLTVDAQRRWTPESSILTYGELGDPVGEQEVALPMTGIERYDARGAWQGSRAAKVMRFDLTTEDGEWRIDGLPDALIVPETWFEDQFRRCRSTSSTRPPRSWSPSRCSSRG